MEVIASGEGLARCIVRGDVLDPVLIAIEVETGGNGGNEQAVAVEHGNVVACGGGSPAFPVEYLWMGGADDDTWLVVAAEKDVGIAALDLLSQRHAE
jgi:hypothetical protein